MTSHRRHTLRRARSIAAAVSVTLLLAACGGSSDDDSDDAIEAVSDAEELRQTIETGLRQQLTVELGFTADETDCVSEQVMADWNDIDGLLDQPEVMANNILERVQAAEESCFTSDRRDAIEASTAASAADTAEYGADEQAFLVAMADAPEVTGEPAMLLTAGRLVCAFADDVGSLTTFLETLTPGSTTAQSLADELAPALGSTLTAGNLQTVSLISVVSLCPDINDL